MSLIVWYPFTKDFENKGLSGINTTTSSGLTLTNCNKFGKSLYLSGSTSVTMDNFPAEEAFGKTSWSISFWCNYKNDGERGIILGSYKTIDTSYRGFNIEINSSTHTEDNNIRIWWWVGDNRQDIISNVVCDANTWVYITITYNGTALKFYKNGVFVESFEYTLQFEDIGSTWYLGRDIRSATGRTFVGNLHDFRIYNHCLSSKEIKELSKGLILHYDLKGYNTNPNLIDSNTSYSGEGAPYYVYKDGPSTSTVIFFQSPVMNLKTNTDYTLSFDARLVTDDDTLIQFVDRDLYPDSLPQSNLTWTNGPTNKWKHFTWTTRSSNSDMSNARVRIFVDQTDSATGNKLLAPIEFRNIKFEESPKETPFIPHDSFSDTTEYDLSGNGYDGVKQGITYSTDTPRYCLSSEFDSNKDLVFSDSRIYHNGDEVSNLSISIWANFDSSIGHNLWNLNQNNFIRMRPATLTTMSLTCVGNYGSFNLNIGQTLAKNTWYHFVLTFDKGVFKFYTNGVLGESIDKSDVATTIKCSGNTQRWSLGDYDSNTESFVGKLSDFRIYSTTLTADDVKELYQTSATIDKTGKLYCGTLIEE